MYYRRVLLHKRRIVREQRILILSYIGLIRLPFMQLFSIILKLIFYKNNAKLPIVTRNLHDPAPIFQANTHQNTGQNRANFV